MQKIPKIRVFWKLLNLCAFMAYMILVVFSIMTYSDECLLAAFLSYLIMSVANVTYDLLSALFRLKKGKCPDIINSHDKVFTAKSQFKRFVIVCSANAVFLIASLFLFIFYRIQGMLVFWFLIICGEGTRAVTDLYSVRSASIADGILNKYELLVFKPKNRASKKFALICPGGGYGVVCTETEGIPVAYELTDKGYTAFVLRYRTKRKAKYPAPQEDLEHALEYIRSHASELGVEFEDYSLWGFSAGGHLAASFCTDNMGYKNYNLAPPAALVLSYPVITMGVKGHKDSYKRLFGKPRTAEKEDFGSIEKHVTKEYPSTYIWCCENDNMVPDENTKLMIYELEKNNVNHIGKIVEGVKKGHGIVFGERTNAYGWFDEAVEFWENRQGTNNVNVLHSA